MLKLKHLFLQVSSPLFLISCSLGALTILQVCVEALQWEEPGRDQMLIYGQDCTLLNCAVEQNQQEELQLITANIHPLVLISRMCRKQSKSTWVYT
jgi:hypothetical protein